MWWALAALAALFAARRSEVSEVPASAQEIRDAAARLGVSQDWGTFLAAVAHHESRWNIDAANRSSSEAAAARALYEAPQNAWLRDCGNPAEWYSWGSGGWYGMLPASAMRAFSGTPLACEDPRRVLADPLLSTAAALGYAQRLMGWKAWRRSDKSWRALNRGWAAPGKMDQPLEGTDKRWERALRALGVPSSWGRSGIDQLPHGWTPFGAYMAAKGSTS